MLRLRIAALAAALVVATIIANVAFQTFPMSAGTSSQCSDPQLTALLPPVAEMKRTMAAFVARPGRDAYDDAPPLYPCRPIQRVGGASDGGKLVCNVLQLRAPCIVYSLGSNLDFSFESAIVEATPCVVVTADCTVDRSAALKLLPPRTTFVPYCLGSLDSGEFLTLLSLMAMLGHTHVDYLKVCHVALHSFVRQQRCHIPFNTDGYRGRRDLYR
jgi:hypothetical protein